MSIQLYHSGIGNGLGNALYYFIAFFYTLVTPFLLGPPIYIHGFLYMTAGINLLGCVYVTLALPETKVGC